MVRDSRYNLRRGGGGGGVNHQRFKREAPPVRSNPLPVGEKFQVYYYYYMVFLSCSGANPGGGLNSTKFYTGRLRPEVQPLTLLHHY